MPIGKRRRNCGYLLVMSIVSRQGPRLAMKAKYQNPKRTLGVQMGEDNSAPSSGELQRGRLDTMIA